MIGIREPFYVFCSVTSSGKYIDIRKITMINQMRNYSEQNHHIFYDPISIYMIALFVNRLKTTGV